MVITVGIEELVWLLTYAHTLHSSYSLTLENKLHISYKKLMLAYSKVLHLHPVDSKAIHKYI